MQKGKLINKPFFIIFTVFALFFCCSCGRAEKEPDIMGTVDWGGLVIGGTPEYFTAVLRAEELEKAGADYTPIIFFAKLQETRFMPVINAVRERDKLEKSFSGMKGIYISSAAEYVFDMYRSEIKYQIYYLFNEDKELAGYVCIFPKGSGFSATAYGTSAYGNLNWSYRKDNPDSRYITIDNAGKLLFIDEHNRITGSDSYITFSVEGDYYHTLDYHRLGISYNDMADEEKMVWIKF